MKTFKEAPREIPVMGEYDVIVVGGGTAGVGAAVAAGREGAKTLVIEQAGWLIGYMDTLWGQGLTHAITFQDKNDRIIMKGIPYEIVDRLYRQNAAIMPIRRNVIKNTWDKELDNNYNRWQASIDPEVAKDLAFTMCEEAGVPFRTLLPKKVEGLLVAGRCISMDHPSVATLRKIPLCIAMGEAAGTAAALCARLGVTTHQLDVLTLQRQLLKNGVLLNDELTAKLEN